MRNLLKREVSYVAEASGQPPSGIPETGFLNYISRRGDYAQKVYFRFLDDGKVAPLLPGFSFRLIVCIIIFLNLQI